ncbi:MAG: hypothetical protein ACREGR_04680 [Minisyncoccia bacterium]
MAEQPQDAVADNNGDGVKQSLWLRLWAIRTAIARTGLWLVAIVVLIGAGIISWPTLVRNLTPAHDGQIIVNSPAVYTRQRLVNDRLSQTSWLQDQLLVTKVNPPPKEPFRSIDEIRTDAQSKLLKGQINIATGTAAGVPSQHDGNQEPPVQGTNTTTSPPVAVPSVSETTMIQPTTADLFRAKNAYREEVRSEIMETQLDDRHDIDGNTIYRLSFDATVLPGTKTDVLAVIKVGLQHGVEVLDGEYVQLYEDWLRYMQKTVAASIEAIANELLGRSPDPRLQIELPNFIVRAVCQISEAEAPKNNRIANTKMAREESQNTDKPDACDPEMLEATASPSDSDYDAAKTKIKAASEKIRKFTSDYLAYRKKINLALAKANLQFAAAAAKAERAELDYAIDTLSLRCAQSPITAAIRDFSTGKDVQVECPPNDSPYEPLIGAAILYGKLSDYNAQRDHRPSDEKEIDDKINELIKEITSHCNSSDWAKCSQPDPDLGQLRCLAADYMWGSLNRFDANVKSQTAHRIDRYFRVQIVGRETGNCTLVISRRPRDNAHEDQDPVKLLMHDLNTGIEVYSYSITPKNLAQRIATTSDTRDAVQALVNARAVAKEHELSSLVEALRQRSSQSRRIQSNPIVVGFGTALQTKKLPGQALALRSSDPPVMEFGWVVAPQLQPGNDNERAQVDGQYSVAAVISVPAWWRSISLSVETCWVTRPKLHIHEHFDGCSERDMPPMLEHHVVRLPGFIPDVSRKLGFDVQQEPRLDPPNGPPPTVRLQVGRPAELLLKGKRLWRSTEVTLGAQKADEIVVLPNMDGIVAKFRCVHQQPKSMPPQPVEIRVWTSEGVTEPLNGELVSPNDGPQAGQTSTASDQAAKVPPQSRPKTFLVCPDEQAAMEAGN